MRITDTQEPLEVGVASGATIHPSEKCSRVWQTQGHFIFIFQENPVETSSFLLALEFLSVFSLRSLLTSYLLSTSKVSVIAKRREPLRNWGWQDKI